MSADELIEIVMRMPAAERDAFLERLNERLDVDAGGAILWTSELERRAREALRGEHLVDADRVFAQLDADLRALQARR